MSYSIINRIMAALCVVASVSVNAASRPVEWKFPREGGCHEGLAFADGVTGVLVWGGGDTVENFRGETPRRVEI